MNIYDVITAKDGERLKKFLNEGGNPNQLDFYGRPLITYAIRSNFVFMVTILLDGGADVNLVDSRGWTPLHWSANLGPYGDPNITRVLLERGAKINVKNNDGKTPLELARLYNSEPFVKVLKEYIEKDKAVNYASLALYKNLDDVIRQIKSQEQSLPPNQVRVAKRYTEGEHGEGPRQLPVGVIQNIRSMVKRTPGGRRKTVQRGGSDAVLGILTVSFQLEQGLYQRPIDVNLQQLNANDPKAVVISRELKTFLEKNLNEQFGIGFEIVEGNADDVRSARYIGLDLDKVKNYMQRLPPDPYGRSRFLVWYYYADEEEGFPEGFPTSTSTYTAEGKLKMYFKNFRKIKKSDIEVAAAGPIGAGAGPALPGENDPEDSPRAAGPARAAPAVPGQGPPPVAVPPPQARAAALPDEDEDPPESKEDNPRNGGRKQRRKTRRAKKRRLTRRR